MRRKMGTTEWAKLRAKERMATRLTDLQIANLDANLNICNKMRKNYFGGAFL